MKVHDVAPVDANEARVRKFALHFFHGAVDGVRLSPGVDHDVVLERFHKQQVLLLHAHQTAAVLHEDHFRVFLVLGHGAQEVRLRLQL